MYIHSVVCAAFEKAISDCKRETNPHTSSNQSRANLARTEQEFLYCMCTFLYISLVLPCSYCVCVLFVLKHYWTIL